MGYIICRAQCKIKMHSPLLKIIKMFNIRMATSEHFLVERGALRSTGPWVTPGTCLTHGRILVLGPHAGGFLSSESVPCMMARISDDGLSCQTQEGEEECHYNCIQGYFNQGWLLLLKAQQFAAQILWRWERHPWLSLTSVYPSPPCNSPFIQFLWHGLVDNALAKIACLHFYIMAFIWNEIYVASYRSSPEW